MKTKEKYDSFDWCGMWEELRATLLHDKECGHIQKTTRALMLMDEIEEREKKSGGGIQLGCFVVDKEDKSLKDLAVVVYDHRWHGYDLFCIKRLADGHISNRSAEELRVVDPLSACKVWCKKQIDYP